jgi:isocitrate dehydrogenase
MDEVSPVAFNSTDGWLPEQTVEAFQEYLVGIKGPDRPIRRDSLP